MSGARWAMRYYASRLPGGIEKDHSSDGAWVPRGEGSRLETYFGPESSGQGVKGVVYADRGLESADTCAQYTW
jgi:hypothetical protein